MTAKATPPEDTEPKAEDREETGYSYPALKLQQNGHVIYFITIPIDDLFPMPSSSDTAKIPKLAINASSSSDAPTTSRNTWPPRENLFRSTSSCQLSRPLS